MPLEQFSLEAVGRIDAGRIGVAWQKQLAALERDCGNRPNLKAARKLELTVTLTPVADDRGELVDVDVQFAVSAKAPKSESKIYRMRPTPDGLMYQELAPEDPDQTTIFSSDDLATDKD